MLVKADSIPADRTPQQYADLGIVDARFAEFTRDARYAVKVVDATQWREIEAALKAS